MKHTPWVYKRKDRDGWYVGWYDKEGRRRRKSFPNQALAKQFQARKLLELNDDYHSPNEPNPLSWDTVCEEYVKFLEFKRRSTAHATKQLRTLQLFAKLQNIKTSSQVTQKTVQEYMAKYVTRETRFERPPSEASVYYELTRLRAFIKWASHPDRRHIVGNFDLKQDKAKEWRKARALPEDRVAKLLAVFNDDTVVAYPDAWRTRILIAASTGLRREDIEKLAVDRFYPDPDSPAISVWEKKSKKWTWRPIHLFAWTYIWPYLQTVPRDAPRIFPDAHTSRKWERICNAAGLPYPGFRYHDLRVLFTSSLAAKNVPTGVAQKLLNHSTADLTNRVYTDFDPTLRPAVSLLPVEGWAAKINPSPEAQPGTKSWKYRKRPRVVEKNPPASPEPAAAQQQSD